MALHRLGTTGPYAGKLTGPVVGVPVSKLPAPTDAQRALVRTWTEAVTDYAAKARSLSTCLEAGRLVEDVELHVRTDPEALWQRLRTAVDETAAAARNMESTVTGWPEFTDAPAPESIQSWVARATRDAAVLQRAARDWLQAIHQKRPDVPAARAAAQRMVKHSALCIAASLWLDVDADKFRTQDTPRQDAPRPAASDDAASDEQRRVRDPARRDEQIVAALETPEVRALSDKKLAKHIGMAKSTLQHRLDHTEHARLKELASKRRREQGERDRAAAAAREERRVETLGGDRAGGRAADAAARHALRNFDDRRGQ